MKNFALTLALSIAALLGGAVVLFLTFWFTYAVIWIGSYGVSALAELIFSRSFSVSHLVRLIGSGAFLLLLFVQHFRADPWHWGDYPRRQYVASPALQHQMGAASIGWLVAYPGASANMIADVLLTGPRLVVGAIHLARRTVHLAKLEVVPCSEILCLLLARSGAVSYEELRRSGWQPWLEQLRCLEGVNFLEKGLSLSDELRGAILENSESSDGM